MGFVNVRVVYVVQVSSGSLSFMVTVNQTSIFPVSERRAGLASLVTDCEASLLNICNKLTDVKTQT